MSEEAELLNHTWVVQRISALNNFQLSSINEYEKSLSSAMRSWRVVTPSVHLSATGNQPPRHLELSLTGFQNSDARYMSFVMYSENKLVFSVVLFPKLGILLSKGKKAVVQRLLEWLRTNFDVDLASAVLPSFKLEQMLVALLEVGKLATGLLT